MERRTGMSACATRANGAPGAAHSPVAGPHASHIRLRSSATDAEATNDLDARRKARPGQELNFRRVCVLQFFVVLIRNADIMTVDAGIASPGPRQPHSFWGALDYFHDAPLDVGRERPVLPKADQPETYGHGSKESQHDDLLLYAFFPSHKPGGQEKEDCSDDGPRPELP